MFETFKKTLNNSQLSIFENLEREINKMIEDRKNVILALDLLAYYPKKDGTPKNNFKMNFGLAEPFGEYKYIKKWNERYRFAEIVPGYNYGGEITSISIDIRSQKNRDEDTEKLPETPFNGYIDETFYTDIDEVTKFTGFKLRENKYKVTPELVFNLVKNYYLPKQRERLENYKKELENLPKYFKKFVNMANKMQELVKETYNFSTLHNFAYENFEAKQTYFLLDNNFKR